MCQGKVKVMNETVMNERVWIGVDQGAIERRTECMVSAASLALCSPACSIARPLVALGWSATG